MYILNRKLEIVIGGVEAWELLKVVKPAEGPDAS